MSKLTISGGNLGGLSFIPVKTEPMLPAWKGEVVTYQADHNGPVFKVSHFSEGKEGITDAKRRADLKIAIGRIVGSHIRYTPNTGYVGGPIDKPFSVVWNQKLSRFDIAEEKPAKKKEPVSSPD